MANVLQAAWALVLRSFTHSDQICFGYLSSCRDVPVKGIHDAIGLFVNMILSRADFASQPSIAEVTKTFHKDYVGALANPNCSLRDMQKLAELGPSRPLFDTIMSYQQEARGGDDVDQQLLQFEQVSGNDPTEYALAVGVAASDVLDVCISYYTDVITASRAKSIASSFETVLEIFRGGERQW